MRLCKAIADRVHFKKNLYTYIQILAESITATCMRNKNDFVDCSLSK